MKNDFILSRIVRVFRGVIDVFLLLICKLISCLTSKGSHWVIYERGTDARDNAYFFYNFLKEKHPEKKVCYVINKASPDYEKVKEDAVSLGSLKNYWVVITAEKLISTHYGTCVPSFISVIFKLYGLDKKFCFLQHGITTNGVSLKGNEAPMQLLICGAKPEYEYIVENFGHPSGVVQYTGFARFDNLHDTDANKRQILVMPTWRYYIHSKEQFMKSDYYILWQNLIKDKKLIHWLEENDLMIIFYVHYEMQKYIDCFQSDSNRVIIAEFSKYDVQSLLKESAVLITDYSSVFFDFAYMRKPIIYYQFDDEQFFSQHYNRGYFDYRSMGFGDVCTKAEEVISALINIANNGMTQEQKYEERCTRFFPLYDTKNCERIYEAIINH